MSKLVDLFCDVDDFCKVFIPQWHKKLLEDGSRKRQRVGQREGQMTTSEIITIVVSFHMSHYRDFKNYYIGYVSLVYKNSFPNLLGYTRFLAVMPRVIVPMCAYFTSLKGKPTGLEFIDSTSNKVCHNIRMPSHKIFDGIAQRGKGTMGWYYRLVLWLQAPLNRQSSR
jgi:hypothetical protein